MRLAAIHPPRKKPKRCIASYPYWEHEGVNRHDEGRTTDSVRWYIRIKKRAINFTAVTFAYLDGSYPSIPIKPLFVPIRVREVAPDAID